MWREIDARINRARDASMSQRRIVLSLLSGCLLITTFARAQANIQEYRIDSPYQQHSTVVRVLLPDRIDTKRTYRVLYVLPVVENNNRKHGDGLQEMVKHDFHNIHQLICVAPEFTAKPWYADHSDNMGRQDESHLLKTVLPFIDRRFPTSRTREGRLLIGFSKSGWGAITLLMRNPETFHKAAAWDTGIRVDTGPIDEQDRERRIQAYFGSKDNFERYRISTLIESRGKHLGGEERLFYYNTEGKRAKGGVEVHRLLVESGIPHRYLFEKRRQHRWDSGWIPLAVKFLVETDNDV